MNNPTDQQLLRDYAEHRVDAAFTELVRRHIDMIHSAAYRMTGETHSARDVTQAVFVTLAQNAARLADHPILSGWLHTTARNVAAKHIRTEVRRQHHEQEAAAMNDLIATSPDASWQEIAPQLDAALGELDEADRNAVMLRYFDKNSAREIAARLGISDEAAQKRVSRAVERLRESFARRGIAVGSSGLTVVIAANAVQAAPVGLAVTISAVALAGTAATTSTIVAATTKAIAMTTLQKTAIAATVAILAGAGIYEARQAAQLREQNQTLQQQQTPLSEQVGQLSKALTDATNQLATLRDDNERSNRNTGELLKLRGEVARLRNDTNEQNDPTKTAAQSWLNRVSQLKQRLDQSPEANIPELKFIETEDWLAAVKNRQLESDIDYRRAFSSLRKAAENIVASDLKKALKEYLKNNGGQFPTDLTQLQPYLSLSIDDQIFKRWEIAPAKKVPSLGVGGDWIITQKSAVDDVFDTRFGIGPDGFGTTDFLSQEVAPTMNAVWDAYKTAHDGQWPDDVSQLQPYATTPEQQAALQKLILKNSNSKL